MRSIRTTLVLLALVWLLNGALAWSQQAAASLRGNVSDASGAVVPNAQVALVNTGTGVRRTTTSGATGRYEILQLVPATYRLEVEAEGFRKLVQDGIVLLVNQNAVLDVRLEVGARTEIVEVTENVSLVDTVTATLGNVETGRRISDLPLVGRDTLQLGLLQAGVFAPDPDDGSGNPFSVSGQRSESVTFLVDGADNNDFLSNNIVVSPNPDAVEEFKILTNNYDAEYGHSAGGIVNQVIKSGSNSVHGGLFEFVRNDALNAREFFLPDRTSFKRNVFGGSIGGPFKKDKSFFFGNYQGTRRREGQIAPILSVLSPAERGGDFSELLPNTQLIDPVSGLPYPNNQVPVNPVSANYISKYLPTPNLSGNQFISGPTGRIRDDQVNLRIDHNFSEKDVLSGVYLFEDTPDYFPFLIQHGASTGGNVPVGSAFTDAHRFQSGSIAWTHTFGPTVLNEFRVAGNRTATLQSSPVDHTPPSALGFTNLNPDDLAGVAPPPMFVTGAFNLGPSPQGPTTLHDATFQWQDTLSVIRGKHTLKFGADIRRVRLNFNFDFFTNGSYFFGESGSFTGSTLADFVAGFPDQFFQFSTALYGIRTTSWHYFGQDSWKATSRLTLNFGLRYEYNSPQIDPHNNILGYFPGHQSTVFPSAPPGILYPGDPGTPNRSLVYPDRNNFAPRFGFAWDVKGNSKLVVRGGIGVFYDIEDGGLNLQFGGQPPFGDGTDLFPGTFATTTFLQDPFGNAPGGSIQNPYPFASQGRVGTFLIPKVSFAYVVDPRFRTPYSENFNFGLQQQLTTNTRLEAVYVGSLGRKLIATTDLNFPNPSDEMRQLALVGGNSALVNIDCARPLSGCFGTTDPVNASLTDSGLLLTNLSNAISDSHQLQVTLDKRLSHGFDLRGAYTLAKTIDLSSGFRARSSTYTNPLNYGQDRALADFDATHRLVVSGFWELPLDRPFHARRFLRKLTEGWETSGILTFQSGNPINLFQNNGSSLQNNFLERPDQLGPILVFHDPRKVRTFSPGANGVNGSCLAGSSTGNFYFAPYNLDCANVPLFTFGTLGRNAFRGPGIDNWDLCLMKKTSITERQSIEFRAEFFNTWNHAQFSNPDNNGFSGTFGQIVSTRPHDSGTTSGARIIQFGLKYYF